MPEYEVDITAYATYTATIIVEAEDDVHALDLAQARFESDDLNWEFNDADFTEADFEAEELNDEV